MLPKFNNPSQLLFLFGSPRSGTTWLAKIIDTLDGVLYLHEPLAKLKDGSLEPLKSQLLANGHLSAEEREELLSRMIARYIDCAVPPFFPKRNNGSSHWRDRASWAARALGCRRISSALVRQTRYKDFDLLIKEVDWKLQSRNIINGLAPDCLIRIVRHPCAVVLSLARGIEMGLMPAHDRHAWLNHNRERALDLGYTSEDITKMSTFEFLALEWLLQNLLYHEAIADHPRSVTVVYERLCADPPGIMNELSAAVQRAQTRATSKFLSNSTTDVTIHRLFSGA